MARSGTDRWDAHPWLARWVRLAVLLVPLLVSALAALLVIALLPDTTTPAADVGWWVAVLGSAFLAAQVVDRWANRALPLAALLQLSLVFPDRAPSRLQAARRTSLRELEKQVAALEGDVSGPAEAARTLVALVGALGRHDKRTRGHSERVRAYVDLITEEMGLPEEDRMRLRWAALLHDIGKLQVPGALLNAGRDLTDEQWGALREHPLAGERMAAALLPWLGEWGLCVREHHERWDGHGYPQGLAGTQISLAARIVAVADSFEVMTANRSYQQAVSPAAARKELLRCAGSDFDPGVVRVFLQVSVGRLRGVLGPLSLLPVVPFAFAGRRTGDLGRGITAVAAASVVAIGLATSPARPAVPPATLGGGHQLVPPAAPVPTPTPTPTLSPTPRPRPSPAAVAQVPRPRPRRAVVPRATTPTAGVLFLAPQGTLSTTGQPSGTASARPGGAAAAFSVAVSGTLRLTGVPTLVLFEQLQSRHGRGHPSASLIVNLQDCQGSTCRTLSTGSTGLPQAAGVQELVVALGRVDTVVRAGDVLRVSVYVVGRDNVDSLTVLFGGSTPSRLEMR